MLPVPMPRLSPASGCVLFDVSGGDFARTLGLPPPSDEDALVREYLELLLADNDPHELGLDKLVKERELKRCQAVAKLLRGDRDDGEVRSSGTRS